MTCKGGKPASPRSTVDAQMAATETGQSGNGSSTNSTSSIRSGPLKKRPRDDSTSTGTSNNKTKKNEDKNENSNSNSSSQSNTPTSTSPAISPPPPPPLSATSVAAAAASALPATAYHGPGSEPNPAWIKTPLFVTKTYEMLSDCDASVAAWTKEGDRFVVKDQAIMSEKYIPQFFGHSNFASFDRQLNFYGFRKSYPESLQAKNNIANILHLSKQQKENDDAARDATGAAVENSKDTKGSKSKSKGKDSISTIKDKDRDKDGKQVYYYHEHFKRGHPELFHLIKRHNTKKAKLKPKKADSLLSGVKQPSVQKAPPPRVPIAFVSGPSSGSSKEVAALKEEVATLEHSLNVVSKQLSAKFMDLSSEVEQQLQRMRSAMYEASAIVHPEPPAPPPLYSSTSLYARQINGALNHAEASAAAAYAAGNNTANAHTRLPQDYNTVKQEQSYYGYGNQNRNNNANHPDTMTPQASVPVPQVPQDDGIGMNVGPLPASLLARPAIHAKRSMTDEIMSEMNANGGLNLVKPMTSSNERVSTEDFMQDMGASLRMPSNGSLGIYPNNRSGSSGNPNGTGFGRSTTLDQLGQLMNMDDITTPAGLPPSLLRGRPSAGFSRQTTDDILNGLNNDCDDSVADGADMMITEHQDPQIPPQTSASIGNTNGNGNTMRDMAPPPAMVGVGAMARTASVNLEIKPPTPSSLRRGGSIGGSGGVRSNSGSRTIAAAAAGTTALDNTSGAGAGLGLLPSSLRNLRPVPRMGRFTTEEFLMDMQQEGSTNPLLGTIGGKGNCSERDTSIGALQRMLSTEHHSALDSDHTDAISGLVGLANSSKKP